VQSASSTFGASAVKALPSRILQIYGLLREAWERELEEVLLGGVVERYRTGIQTQQIEDIADITLAYPVNALTHNM